MKWKIGCLLLVIIAIVGVFVLRQAPVETLEKPVIKIGASFPLTGDVAFIGQAGKNAMEMAIADLGDTKYTYKLFFEDDELDARHATTAATKLIESDEVHALTSMSSGIGNVISPIAQNNEVIHFGIASDENIAVGDYNFIHWTPPSAQAEKMVEELQRRGIKSIAGLWFNQQGMVVIRDELYSRLDKVGIEVVSNQIFDKGETDFRTTILKIEQTNPDIIIVGAFTPELELIETQLRERNVKTPRTSIESFEISEQPDLFEGYWFVNAADPQEEFQSQYKERYNDGFKLGTANAYDVVHLLVEAFENAGDGNTVPHTSDVLRELNSIEEYSGALGALTVGPEGIVYSPAVVKRVVNGKFVVLSADNDPLKLGAMMPLTGDAASFGQSMRNAMELATEEVNSKGGINGRELSFIYEDAKCTPSEASKSGNRLINVENVPVIVGGVCSSETMAVAPLAESTQTVIFSPCSSVPDITNAGDYIFRAYPSDAFQSLFAAQQLYDAGVRTVGLLYCLSDWCVGLQQGFTTEFTRLGGSVVLSQGYEQDTQDLRTQLTRIKNADVDALYFPGYTEATIIGMQQIQQLGLDSPIYGADAWDDPKIWETLGSVGNGAQYTVIASDVPTDFNERFKAKYGSEIQLCATQAYDIVHILADVMNDVGTDPTAVKDALYLVDHQGVSGHIRLDGNGDLEGANYVIKEVKDGVPIVQ